VTVHASLDDDPVFVQYGHILATTFHPELNDDDLFHRYFLSI
jgi:5'-phosphate synthase pdxT subunit